MLRDLAFAEDLAQEALLVAMDRWPAAGIPGNPGAWLGATARNREERRRDIGRVVDLLVQRAALAGGAGPAAHEADRIDVEESAIEESHGSRRATFHPRS